MTESPHYSYTSPKLELRSFPQKGGFGLFAREYIKSGETLCVWSGQVYTEEQLADVPIERAQHGLQVEENVYLLPLGVGDPADYVNHSCDPNAGLNGQICLVAIRDILLDEEVCFDYAMSDSSDYDEFECHCGSPMCRGRITGNDWKIPELQNRYDGYFIPYLQRRIDVVKKSKKNDRQYVVNSVDELTTAD
jgi:uncharacterized protein